MVNMKMSWLGLLCGAVVASSGLAACSDDGGSMMNTAGAGGMAGAAGGVATAGGGAAGTGMAAYTPRGPEPQAILALVPNLDSGGAAWRDQACETCHGPDGKGVPALGSDLTVALATKSELNIVDVIYYGAPPEGNPLMVAFGGPNGSLTDQQVADVFGYIKATFGGGI